MNSYYAYHGPDNKTDFDYTNGYGFEKETKLKKLEIGDEVYIVQGLKIKGKHCFKLCGKYKVIEKYYDENFIGREHRVRLSDASKLSSFLNIDEDDWSNRLPNSERKDQKTNFKKHFCFTGATLQSPLSHEVISVIEHYLSSGSKSAKGPTSFSIAQGDLVGDLKVIENSDLSDSEKEILTKARVGQGKFKSDVIKTWQGEKCAVTLVSIKEMLIASHIKAWKDCENTGERLDGANGILLCAHVDKLFDNHLITFKCKNNRYYLNISNSVNISQLKGLGIEKGIELEVSHLDFKASERFQIYMQHHNRLFAEKESIDTSNT
ncbi:HNH endonuclease [Shewanella glacialimarina]|uniref:HNH endonuclease n=1 Tax=Shewanella glacialimarina TaxID=2590884 RepID=UPI001CF8D3BC|nr:HNH endonuclease signature motif containing protein [Shewanella glacialimarina]UCX05604.1 HNH endonuclease [Shewanella glacialimarina]